MTPTYYDYQGLQISHSKWLSLLSEEISHPSSLTEKIGQFSIAVMWRGVDYYGSKQRNVYRVIVLENMSNDILHMKGFEARSDAEAYQTSMLGSLKRMIERNCHKIKQTRSEIKAFG